MFHGPATPVGIDHATSYKMRLGILMFIIYAIIFIGFVAINILNPLLMEATILFGLNLAVVYGFGLIIFALLSALIYNAMCMKKEFKLNSGDNSIEEGK